MLARAYVENRWLGRSLVEAGVYAFLRLVSGLYMYEFKVECRGLGQLRFVHMWVYIMVIPM